MNFDDLKVTQDYFKNEEMRDPTETELKVLDTYWSDHCRHTTFSTIITDIKVEDGEFKEILEKDIENYKTSRHAVYGIETTRPITLMDLATISMKQLRKLGYLDDLEVSEEINACSIEIKINVNGEQEDWLLMFKNETHNHPTEIEPFGGAATCLGGAIRDPLSGRTYVYQAMRVTGAADPNADATAVADPNAAVAPAPLPESIKSVKARIAARNAELKETIKFSNTKMVDGAKDDMVKIPSEEELVKGTKSISNNVKKATWPIEKTNIKDATKVKNIEECTQEELAKMTLNEDNQFCWSNYTKLLKNL